MLFKNWGPAVILKSVVSVSSSTLNSWRHWEPTSLDSLWVHSLNSAIFSKVHASGSIGTLHLKFYSQILALYWSNSVTRFYRILVSSSRDFTWHRTLIFLFKVQTLLPNNHYKFSSLEIFKVSKMLLWVYLNDFYWIKFKMWFQEIFSSNAVLSNL